MERILFSRVETDGASCLTVFVREDSVSSQTRKAIQMARNSEKWSRLYHFDTVQAIGNKRLGMLRHDNAGPHIARQIQEMLQKFKNWIYLPPPPCSPDLVPSV